MSCCEFEICQRQLARCCTALMVDSVAAVDSSAAAAAAAEPSTAATELASMGAGKNEQAAGMQLRQELQKASRVWNPVLPFMWQSYFQSFGYGRGPQAAGRKSILAV